jgi:hypothetical protein
MKFLIQIIFILILGYLLELFLPWWSVAIAAALGGLIFNTRSNFGAGILAIGLLWMLKALITDAGSNVELADRVAMLLQVKQKSLLLLVTFLLSGLVGGFAAMAGSALRRNKKKSYESKYSL